jgi:hypothetical protein
VPGGAVSSGGSRGESLRGYAVLKRAERKARGGRQPWGEPGRELGGRFEGSRGGSPGGWASLREVERRARVGRRLWRKPGRELGGESSLGRRARKGGYLWRGSIRELGVAGSSGGSQSEVSGGYADLE